MLLILYSTYFSGVRLLFPVLPPEMVLCLFELIDLYCYRTFFRAAPEGNLKHSIFVTCFCTLRVHEDREFYVFRIFRQPDYFNFKVLSGSVQQEVFLFNLGEFYKYIYRVLIFKYVN